MTDAADLEIFNGIRDYCLRYNIPIGNLLDILEDQKVLPMIRGKATEFIATAFLSQTLNTREWRVQKLNLNPQSSTYDEDISITFARTGDRLKVEAKNAVRGSFRLGTSRTLVSEPHFKVKCHKSRSNIGRQATTNDRYMADEFDLIICNISNAMFRGKVLRPELALLDDPQALDRLSEFYGISDPEELIRCSYDDWRFCFSQSIALPDGSIPRTPTVKLENDENWFGADQLHNKLLEFVEERRRSR